MKALEIILKISLNDFRLDLKVQKSYFNAMNVIKNGEIK